MTNLTPIYDAVVAEQNFDPVTITYDFAAEREARRLDHKNWYEDLIAGVANMKITKKKSNRKPKTQKQ